MPERSLHYGAILGAGAIIVAAIALSITVALLIPHLHRMPPGGMPIERPAPPRVTGDDASTLAEYAPQLQAAPQDDLAAWRREESRRARTPADFASGATP